jgi:hypothetical protein
MIKRGHVYLDTQDLSCLGFSRNIMLICTSEPMKASKSKRMTDCMIDTQNQKSLSLKINDV